MAYEPTTWNCGDTITAEKLNKLENGLAECCEGGSEPLIVSPYENGLYDISVLDKTVTFEDLSTAYSNGRTIFAVGRIGAAYYGLVSIVDYADEDDYFRGTIVSIDIAYKYMQLSTFEISESGYTYDDNVGIINFSQ